jgi:hypothetical protein
MFKRDFDSRTNLSGVLAPPCLGAVVATAMVVCRRWIGGVGWAGRESRDSWFGWRAGGWMESATIGASSEYSKRYSPNSRETHTREEFTTPLCLRVLTTTAYDHHNIIIIIRTVDKDATQIK